MPMRVSSRDRIWHIKVSLQEIEPPIWRRVLVPGAATLDRLNWIIQDAMGWTGSHLHMFIVGDVEYGVPDPEYEMPVKSDRRAKLEQVAPNAGDRFVYEYDFGDSWIHEIVVEKIEPPVPRVRYPTCTGGARACPPEDCGGVSGYEELLTIITDPGHPEHVSTVEWIGRPFDPEAFDLAAANEAIAMGGRSDLPI